MSDPNQHFLPTSTQKPSSNQKVWLITGCSSGFGRYLVDCILSRPSSNPNEAETNGDLIIVTSHPRSLHTLTHLTDPSLNPHHSRIRLVELDVTSPESSIRSSIHSAIKSPFEDGRPGWGRIDILVNNAGFGPSATIEEGGVEALKYCYETNVWGPVKVTNIVVPIMREKGEGKIAFMGSRTAWKSGGPLGGLYSSSKAALHAIVDTYATELAPFGIKVIGIQPGAFRTNAIRLSSYEDGLYLGNGTDSGSKRIQGKLGIPSRTFLPLLASSSSSIESGERGLYQHPVDRPDAYAPQIEFRKKFLLDRGGKEPGDPEKAARVIVDVIKGEGVALNRPTPRWLTLGRDCVEVIKEKCKSVIREVEEWEDVATSTDY